MFKAQSPLPIVSQAGPASTVLWIGVLQVL